MMFQRVVTIAFVRSVLAGVAVGIAEIAIARHHGVWSWVVAVGFNVVFALLLWFPALLLVAAAFRTPALARLRDRLAAPGPARVASVTTIAAVGLAFIVFAVAANATLVHSLQTFHNNARVSIVIALAAMAGEALALFVACTWLVPRASRIAERNAWLARVLRGWTVGLAAYVIGLVALVAAVRVIAESLAPSDPTLGYVGVAAVASVAASAIAVPRLLRGRRATLVVGVLALGMIGAAVVVALGRPEARAELEWSNTPARTVLQRLYALADRDGDGIAGTFIGADCDDGNAAISPLARDVPGDGIDQNCSGADAKPEPGRAGHAATRPPQHLDVLLITIDTLRADHIGSYGAKHPTTPVLDAFSRTATRFVRAYSPSPLTRRALPALLYGRYASTLPFDNTGDAPTLRRNHLPSLPGLFAAAGYQTRLIMSVPGVLEASWLDGFAATQTVGLSNSIDNAPAVTDAALAAYARPLSCPTQTFTWIHYFDPHGPYVRPPGAPDFGDSEEDIYDAEIASLDAQIGRLLYGLQLSGQLAHTIVVIAADHGEGFGEHGYDFHGRSLYDDQIRVPMFIAIPGGRGHVIDAPVSLVDIAPTLLDLLGWSVPPGMNGRSLAAAVENGTAPHGPVLSELIRDRSWVSRDMIAVIDTTAKLIWSIDDDSYEMTGIDGDRPTSGPDLPRLRELLRIRLDAELSAIPGEDDGRTSGRIEAIK